MENQMRVFLTMFVSVVFACTILQPAIAQDEPPQNSETRMTAERLAEIVKNVDAKMQQDGNSLYFHIEELEAAVVYDVAADRMRIMMPIGPVEELVAADFERMMQANFAGTRVPLI